MSMFWMVMTTTTKLVMMLTKTEQVIDIGLCFLSSPSRSELFKALFFSQFLRYRERKTVNKDAFKKISVSLLQRRFKDALFIDDVLFNDDVFFIDDVVVIDDVLFIENDSLRSPPPYLTQSLKCCHSYHAEINLSKPH